MEEVCARQAMDVARAAGADLYVTATFMAVDNDLGLTLNVLRTLAAERQRPLYFAKSRIAMSKEMTAQLGVPLESLAPPRMADSPARRGGSYATCVYCPPPAYTQKARKQKISGVVTLSVSITAEGRASDIQVKKSLEPSLDQQAVETVRTWKFEPAKDASGNAVPVQQMIELAFNLY